MTKAQQTSTRRFLDDCVDELSSLAERGAAALRGASWLRILFWCIVATLILSILPLALGLFLAVMLVRWVAQAIENRRQRTRPRLEFEPSAEGSQT